MAACRERGGDSKISSRGPCVTILWPMNRSKPTRELACILEPLALDLSKSRSYVGLTDAVVIGVWLAHAAGDENGVGEDEAGHEAGVQEDGARRGWGGGGRGGVVAPRRRGEAATPARPALCLLLRALRVPQWHPPRLRSVHASKSHFL